MDQPRMLNERALVPRAVLLLVACVICAWFALGARQAHDVAQARAILSSAGTLPGARAGRVASLLGAAAFMNPDSEVDVLRAELAVARGQSAEAQRLLLGVVHREPLNAAAWFSLAQHSTNGRTIKLAFARLAVLVPRP